jgi:hypothetical protein
VPCDYLVRGLSVARRGKCLEHFQTGDFPTCSHRR